jgi:hypothetical protein
MACAERGAAGIFLILCLLPEEERWHALRGVLQVLFLISCLLPEEERWHVLRGVLQV